jgi:hypothetical protein
VLASRPGVICRAEIGQEPWLSARSRIRLRPGTVILAIGCDEDEARHEDDGWVDIEHAGDSASAA